MVSITTIIITSMVDVASTIVNIIASFIHSHRQTMASEACEEASSTTSTSPLYLPLPIIHMVYEYLMGTEQLISLDFDYAKRFFSLLIVDLSTLLESKHPTTCTAKASLLIPTIGGAPADVPSPTITPTSDMIGWRQSNYQISSKQRIYQVFIHLVYQLYVHQERYLCSI
jgi:hypothetical protein